MPKKTRLSVFLLIGLFSTFPGHSRAAAEAKVFELTPGVTFESSWAGGGVQLFRAELGSGIWRIEARQHGVDLTLTLTLPDATLPDGGRLGPFNSPVGRRGRELALVSLKSNGTVEIELSARAGSAAGRYEIKIVGLEDPRRVAVESALSDAGRRYAEGTAEARREARELYGQAAALCRELGDLAGQTHALSAQAALSRRLREPREAVRLYRQTLEGWRQLGDPVAEAITMNRLGLIHDDLGESAVALELLEKALTLWRRVGDRHTEILLLNNLCLAWQRQGELTEARACYQQALELLGELSDPDREPLVLSNLAGVEWKLGEPERALELYDQALEQDRARGEERDEARILSNRALLYQQLGESEQALADYGRALDIYRRRGDPRREGRMLSLLGSAYLELGEHPRARAWLEQALPLRRQVGDQRGEASTLRALGRAYARSGESRQALDAYGKALALSRNLADRRGEADVLAFIADVHADAGSFPRAVAELERAALLEHSIGDRRLEAEAWLKLGQVRRRMGEPALALESLGRAVEIFRAVRYPLGRMRTLEAMARAERDRGRPHRALALATDARALLGDLRTRAGGASQRAALLASRRGVHELSIDLLMELHRGEPTAGHDRRALELSENSRSRVLLDLLTETGAGKGLTLDPELRQRLRTAQWRLTARVERQLTVAGRRATSDPPSEDDIEEDDIEALERDVHHAVTELERVRAEIRRRSPRSALAGPRTLRADEISALLDPRTLLLEIVLGEDRGFLWAVTPSAVSSFELPGRGFVEELARRAHHDLTLLDLRTGATATEALGALGELLLGPLADLLVNVDRVVVVADGALHYVPFAALPRPASGEPLVASHEVVSLPSASVVALGRQLSERSGNPPGTTTGKTLAVFADPVFDVHDPRLVGSAQSLKTGTSPEAGPNTLGLRAAEALGLPRLARLPATRREAEAIAALVEPGERLLALGFEADRARVMAGELAPYRYLHFATHGLVNPRHPDLSGLVLSQLDAVGRRKNGFLALHDVHGLELSAELVVLSGCQTALGREIRGEGLVGLTRGFLYAGAPRVVASLWQVRDEATAELMTRFYRGLLVQGQRPAAALRAAQLEIRARPPWADPFFWAAFVLQGDWR